MAGTQLLCCDQKYSCPNPARILVNLQYVTIFVQCACCELQWDQIPYEVAIEFSNIPTIS